MARLSFTTAKQITRGLDRNALNSQGTQCQNACQELMFAKLLAPNSGETRQREMAGHVYSTSSMLLLWLSSFLQIHESYCILPLLYIILLYNISFYVKFTEIHSPAALHFSPSEQLSHHQRSVGSDWHAIHFFVDLSGWLQAQLLSQCIAVARWQLDLQMNHSEQQSPYLVSLVLIILLQAASECIVCFIYFHYLWHFFCHISDPCISRISFALFVNDIPQTLQWNFADFEMAPQLACLQF